MSYFAPSSATASLPSGTIVAFAGATAPAGWFICDGSQKDRSTYSALFAVIGTAYGVGNGSSTFNLPDMRQKFPMGQAASGTGAILGATGGSIDHTHAHNHTPSVTVANASGHSHSFSGGSATTGGPTGGNAAASGSGNNAGGQHVHSVSVSGTVGNDSGHGHSVTASVASTTPPTTNPPFVTVNFIIKT